MPTMLKFRSLQKRIVIYDKDDKRSDVEKRKHEKKKKGRFLFFYFLISILQAHSTLSLLLKP